MVRQRVRGRLDEENARPMARGEAQPRAPLTTKKWQEFRVKFELRRGRVDDWTEREEHDLLYNQLTDYWRIQVAKEEKALQKKKILG